jgi:flagellar protein FliS
MHEIARRAYQSTQVQAGDPIGLIVQLYDGVLAFLLGAAERFDAGDRAGGSEKIRRATDIIGELQAVLDMERGAEVAINLDRIYSYCRRRIMEAHLRRESAGLREVIDLLAPLRDAWAEARGKQVEALRGVASS